MSDGGGTGTEQKTLRAYLIVNWKEETLRVRKTEPDSARTSPSELALPLTVEIVVPDVDTPEITKRIEVPPARVEDARAEELLDQERDHTIREREGYDE